MSNDQQLAAHCRDVIANPQDHLDWVVDMARVALSALTQPASPGLKWPDGWRLVPDEPTEEMMRAMYLAQDMCPSAHCDNMRETQMSFARPRYIAALATAPKSPPVPHTAQIDPIYATGGAEWVKCSERMPEVPYHQDQLIVYTDSMIVMAAWFNRIDGIFKDEHNGCVIDDVTHWMPLPAAPEEK